jgi:plastocyanin
MGLLAMKFTFAFAVLLATSAHSANHVVQVAPGNTLSYSPNNLAAAQGDTIEFQFVGNVFGSKTFV